MSSKKDTPAASGMRDYLNKVDDLPTDVLLGRIVLFTITDNNVPCQEMFDAIAGFQLDSIAPPAPNKYLDAFKKATSDVKDSYPMAKDRTGHLLCREVTTTPNFVRRQITREVKDGNRKKLAYDPAIEITFHKPTDPARQESARLGLKVYDQILEPSEREYMHAVAKMIGANYHRYFATFDGMKVRGWVRAYLKRLNAVEIKGGVYFVPVSRDEELTRLAQFVPKMGAGCHMNMIPIVDLERERVFLTEVFEREASQSLREITNEVAELFDSRRSITASTYARIKARYDEVMANASEHMENLQVTQDLTAASAEVAFDSLRKLMTKMLAEGS